MAARRVGLVPPRGFEPLISTLKGWRPRPLDDGGRVPRESTRGPPRPVRAPQPGCEQEEQDDRAGQAAGPDDRRDAAADAEHERPPVPAVDARPPRRRGASRAASARKTMPRTAPPAASSGICDASRTVMAYSDEDDRADERDGQEDDARARSGGAPDAVTPRLRRSGGRPPRCTTGAAASARSPPSRPTSPKPASRNVCASSMRLERPEAVDHPDLEPAAQERSVAPAQHPVLGQVAAQPRHIVAAVVAGPPGTARPGAGRGPPRAARRRSGHGTPSTCRRWTSADASGASMPAGPSAFANETRAPSSASCRARIPSAPSSSRTSRPPDGPSASSARGILASTSRTRAKSLGQPVSEVDG